MLLLALAVLGLASLSTSWVVSLSFGRALDFEGREVKDEDKGIEALGTAVADMGDDIGMMT